MRADPEEQYTEYHSYNVLASKSLYFGVPMMLLVVVLPLILLTILIGLWLIGIYGLLIPILLVALLIMIRAECQQDSRAASWKVWDAKSLFDRAKCGSNVASYTSNVSKQEEVKLREFLENNSVSFESS